MFHPNPPQKSAIGCKPSVSQGNLSGASIPTRERESKTTDHGLVTPSASLHPSPTATVGQIHALDTRPHAALDTRQMLKL